MPIKNVKDVILKNGDILIFSMRGNVDVHEKLRVCVRGFPEEKSAASKQSNSLCKS
ncbi:hypothetical protein GCM10022397_07570 [Flavivirga jejuensis]